MWLKFRCSIMRQANSPTINLRSPDKVVWHDAGAIRVHANDVEGQRRQLRARLT
jgi:hypothetical protein